MIAPGSMVRELSTSMLQLATCTPAAQCAGALTRHSAAGMICPESGPGPPAAAEGAPPTVASPPLVLIAPPLPPLEATPPEATLAPAAPACALSDGGLLPQPRDSPVIATSAMPDRRTRSFRMEQI